MFDETKHILSHGSADNAIVKFTTAAPNVRLLPIYALNKTLTPPVNYIVNDALVHAVPNVQQTLLQFVNAVQLGLIGLYSLLDVTTYLVIDWIEVGAIHRSGGMKAGVDCSKNRTVSRARCAGALSC